MRDLSADRGLIFRITHIENVPWILAHGLHCRNSASFDPTFRNIGNVELIDRRHSRKVPVPPGGTLSDYIPFYFTPRSPMLYNIRTGRGGVPRVPMPDIVMFVAKLPDLVAAGVPCVVADRHAFMVAARFTSGVDGLATVDWDVLRSGNFRRDPDDPGRMERYQAEALVHGSLPASRLAGIVCHGDAQRAPLQQLVNDHQLALKVVSRPHYFFS
ncbi:MAG: DUF4433 domain-containing protein [Gemmatimonadaceae bacterium]|nr:DUF4433 domain-containing protein [Gemmatimonadaceae bacterium]